MVKIGVIGTGRIGKMHIGLLQNSVENVEVTVVCDVFVESVKKVAAEMNIASWTDDPDKVFNNPDLDAVMICSSTDTHAEFIQRAARAGKDVFCEKPIAFDIDLIRETLDVVKVSGTKLQIGFNRRFDPSFARVKDVVESGEIGDVHNIRVTSRDPSPPPVEYIKRSGGLFYDMTIHDFDMVRFLTNSEVKQVNAYGAVLVDKKIGEAGDIDSAVISMVFENGAMGTIENSRQAVYGYDQRVEVFGSKGMVDADNVASNTVHIAGSKNIKSDLIPFFFLERYIPAYINELKHFVDSIASGNTPSVNGNDGLEPVYIAEACMISMKEKRTVLLSEVRK